MPQRSAYSRRSCRCYPIAGKDFPERTLVIIILTTVGETTCRRPPQSWDFSKSDRDMLGSWSAEGSERYSRAAKHKIAMMQKAVSQSFTCSDLDPLAEADDIDALEVFLKSWEVPDQEMLRVKTLTGGQVFHRCTTRRYHRGSRFPS